MIKGIVFDIDNTLLDFMSMKVSAIDAAISSMIDAGLSKTYKEVRESIDKIYNIYGIEYQNVFDRVLEELLGKVDYHILAAGIIAYRRAREGTIALYPHVKLTLMKLIKQNIKLGVLSDAPKKQAWLRLCEVGLNHFFDSVVALEDTGKRKPEPEPFNLILNNLMIKNPNQAIMVGDWAERDIKGAKDIGMITVFARYGDSFDTKDSGADFEISDILNLLDVIKELNDSRNRN